MRIKIISFMTPLYVVGFLVFAWAVWAHTTCPDPTEATVLEKARVELKFKEPDVVVKEKPADKDVLKYTSIYSGEHWRPDANIIAFVKSIENHPLANGKTKLVKYKDFGYIAKGYGTRAKHFKKNTVAEAESIMIDHLLASNKVVDRHVKIDLTHHQRNALVSLVYNIGPFAFRTSKALKALNAGDYKEFKIHAFDPKKGFVCAGGRHNKGLMVRRAHELQIWDKGKYYSQLM